MARLVPRSTMMRPVDTDLFEEFDRLHSRLLDTFGTTGGAMEGWTPALADLEETDEEFMVNVELPGFDRDDIRIEMQGRRLMVTAQREEEQEREGVVRSSTRSFGRLHHEVMLPTDADDEDIEASLDRGVLTIKMKKREGAGRKQIEIS